MKKNVCLYILIGFSSLSAQQNNINTASDGFIGIITDARASGQGDIGVATSADAFSQSWNPSKYMFSDKNLQLELLIFLESQAYQTSLINYT